MTFSKLNLLWALNQRETHPELDDRWKPQEKKRQEEKKEKKLVTLVCSVCGVHFGVTEDRWAEMKVWSPYKDGNSFTYCPKCNHLAVIREVKSDE